MSDLPALSPPKKRRRCIIESLTTGHFVFGGSSALKSRARVKEQKTRVRTVPTSPSCGSSIFNEDIFQDSFFAVAFFSPGEAHKMETEISHSQGELPCETPAPCDICLSLTVHQNVPRAHVDRNTLNLHFVLPDSQWKSTQTPGSMFLCTPLHTATAAADKRQMVCYTVIYCCTAGGAVLFASLSPPE